MLIIEKIENDVITIEDDSGHFDITKDMITGIYHEGDILTENNGIYCVDEKQTQKRKQYIENLQNSIWE